LTKFLLQRPVFGQPMRQRRAELLDDRGEQQVEKTADGGGSPKMAGIGFDLQQIDRIIAGPRTPDIGDQRGGNIPLGGNPTELARGAGIGAGIGQMM
jgi:hypothetical protein